MKFVVSEVRVTLNVTRLASLSLFVYLHLLLKASCNCEHEFDLIYRVHHNSWDHSSNHNIIIVISAISLSTQILLNLTVTIVANTPHCFPIHPQSMLVCCLLNLGDQYVLCFVHNEWHAFYSPLSVWTGWEGPRSRAIRKTHCLKLIRSYEQI